MPTPSVRKPSGTTVGGQFAKTDHAEGDDLPAGDEQVSDRSAILSASTALNDAYRAVSEARVEAAKAIAAYWKAVGKHLDDLPGDSRGYVDTETEPDSDGRRSIDERDTGAVFRTWSDVEVRLERPEYQLELVGTAGDGKARASYTFARDESGGWPEPHLVAAKIHELLQQIG